MSSKTPRPNELDPRLLGVTSLNPWPGHIASSRLQMFSSHITQALPVKDSTDRRCFTGMEAKFGKHTFGVKLEHDSHIIKVFDRYPRTLGDNRIKQNPEKIVLFEFDQENDQGRMVKTIDYISIPTHHSLHQNFGFPFKPGEAIREHMAAGSVLAKSPSISDEGNYRYGLESEVAFMSVPQIIEDGVVVSESYCQRLKTTGVETFVVSWGKKQFPLNLYGDDDQYKIFPDIGDVVRDDGILLTLRGYNDDIGPVTMHKRALRHPDFKYDTSTYVKAGAKVVDVKVHHDSRLRGIIRGKNLNTPVGMSTQPEKYLNAERVFYQAVLNEYHRIYNSRNKNVRISPKLHRLLVEAQAMTVTGDKQRLSRTYRGIPIDEWRVEITIEYPIVPTVGFKLTGGNGDKGVIVDVWPDEDMPIDANGNRAELIMDGLSTIKRMNPSRLYEQYINASSRDLSRRIQQMNAAGASKKEMSDLLLSYYQITSPDMIDMIYKDGMITDAELNSIINDGIYLWMPSNHKLETDDIVRNIQKQCPPAITPVTYRGASGNMVTTKKPIIIGSLYIMLLEKTGSNWAGVASSKLSHFGVPAKLTTADRYSAPGRNQPIRFGESEGRLFVATVGGRATSDLFDRTNNPIVRRMVQEKILNSERPTGEDTLIDRNVFPAGNGRIQQTINHFAECAGWSFKRDPIN